MGFITEKFIISREMSFLHLSVRLINRKILDQIGLDHFDIYNSISISQFNFHVYGYWEGVKFCIKKQYKIKSKFTNLWTNFITHSYLTELNPAIGAYKLIFWLSWFSVSIILVSEDWHVKHFHWKLIWYICHPSDSET